MSNSFATPWTTARQASVYGASPARILEWVAISFSKGSSPPRNQTHVSCIGKYIFFTTEPLEKPHIIFTSILFEDSNMKKEFQVFRMFPRNNILTLWK